MNLNEEQKQFLRENFTLTPDLSELTKKLFDDESLDGRTKEGRAVRKFLAEESLEYVTTAWEKVDDIELDDRQIEFTKAQAKNGLSAFQISELLFPELNIKRFCKEHMSVLGFLREYEPAYVHDSESAVNRAYSPPKLFSTALNKVNEYSHEGLVEERLNLEEKECIYRLLKGLSAPRFIQVISTYSSMKDRILFEAEFVRATWDKPDLTSDEINLYINVCVDYINL